MLSDHSPMPTLAVSDLDRARHFYEDVVGAKARSETPEGIVYGAGSGAFLVYPSQFAGTNKATAASFPVSREEFDAEVSALREKGVTFQTFDAEGVTWSDGVASMNDGEYLSAWFTDPDGNILNVEAGMPVG